MTSPFTDDDELTELYDADVPRVDLVDKAANGISRFLIAKREDGAGLLQADYVRELIGKSEPEPETAGETVTMTGSPAAIAKFIHQAAIAKAEMSGKAINDLPDSAFAYVAPGGKKDDEGKTTPRSLRHFPIHDEPHVRNALSRAPQSPFGDKAMPRIRSAAKKFGIEVSKAMAMELDETADGMDPTVALAAPDGEAPGDPMDPGSPAWEAIDAATAQKWTSIAVRLKNALCVMADREMLEAATGDPDDAESAFDLQDAMCAADYVIDTLAGFAVGEQAEADLATEAMESIGKALADFDTAPLDTIEAFAHVRKAGRVLSSANEAAIRGAVESLQKVLASLPQAPVAPDESGRPVAKEEMTVPATAPASAETVEPDGPAQMGTPKDEPAPAARPVEKADGDAKPEAVAVYDQKGNLVGICSPDDITPIAGAKASDDSAPADDGAAATAAEPAPDASDLTPAPAAEVGTPADAVPDDVTKTTAPDTTEPSTDTTTDAVLKSIVTDAVTAALDAYSATHKEDVAKQAAIIDELAEAVETLKGQVEAYGEQPAPPKVFTNGAVPPAHLLRGQNAGAPPVDVAKVAELRKGLHSPDAATQNQAHQAMNELAIAQLREIHQGR